MFVKILKGEMKKEVTLESYKNYYKNSGWEMAEQDVDVETHNEDDSENWDEVIEEERGKSLNDMNRSELEKKAASLGVDITDCNNNKQIRDRLRSYIN